MKDAIVSVRMPSSLVKELRSLAEKNHYMDLSEELRSVIREKCVEHTMKPDKSSEKMAQQQKTLVTGLQGILKELEKVQK